MDIFGINFSDSDLFLLGAAGAMVGISLAAHLPAVIGRRHAASDAYKSAFADVLLNLRENPDCPLAQIAYGCNPQIVAAIDKRRDELAFWQRNRFERDVAGYKKSYQEATQCGSVFACAMSENTDSAKQNKAQFLQAIEKLLSHA